LPRVCGVFQLSPCISFLGALSLKSLGVLARPSARLLLALLGLEIITTSFGGNVGLPSVRRPSASPLVLSIDMILPPFAVFQGGLTGKSEGLKERMVA
jgi:hypothetical protein